MINVILYFHKLDENINLLKKTLDELQESFPHKLAEVQIDEDLDVYKGFLGKTPVLEIGPYHLYTPFTKQDISMTMGAARDRQDVLLKTEDKKYQDRIARGASITGSDKFSIWLTRHYMIIFNLLLFVFVGLPFLAPVFEKIGATLPAAIIYKIYSPLCHQLPYRSWFLFGEQTAYPRELAGLSGLTFEQVTGLSSFDVVGDKSFVGNQQLGYKVAICERDVAIYGGILVFGILFSLTGRRMKSIPWYLWVILGIIPMGVDGVSQLPSLIAFHISWLPYRESTPLLRTITGLLFGISTAWYGYPLVEETMRDSRKSLIKKFAVNETK
jgi:uncharacterized membrane protein